MLMTVVHEPPRPRGLKGAMRRQSSPTQTQARLFRARSSTADTPFWKCVNSGITSLTHSAVLSTPPLCSSTTSTTQIPTVSASLALTARARQRCFCLLLAYCEAQARDTPRAVALRDVYRLQHMSRVRSFIILCQTAHLQTPIQVRAHHSNIPRPGASHSRADTIPHYVLQAPPPHKVAKWGPTSLRR